MSGPVRLWRALSPLASSLALALASASSGCGGDDDRGPVVIEGETGGAVGTPSGGAPGVGGEPLGGNASGGGSANGGSAGTGGAGTNSGGASASGGGSAGTGEGSAACGTTVTLDPYPFGCNFAWGANGNEGDRTSYLDFVTTWVGYEYSQGRPGDCDGCGFVRDLAGTAATAVYYAYFIGYALPDCNQQSTDNLCTDGAAWIRDNRERLLQLYGDYAAATYAASPAKPVVWLLEGDFVQYTYEEQSRRLSYAELGQLATDIICAIRSNQPNAIVAINHSPWLADAVTRDFWAAMPLALTDFVWTTGVGDNGGYISAGTNASSYNASTARYDFLAELTGKPLWCDTSFGLSQAADSWTAIGEAELNQRIAEGVMGVNVTSPPGDYASRLSGLAPKLSSVCR